MTSYGLTDLCNEIGLTGAARSLKHIFDNAASLLRKWAKIRPGITNASQNKYKGITPYPVSNITTDYAHEWPVDFTPDSDAYGQIKALSQFVDLANDLAYDHTAWSPVSSFEVVVLSNTGTELSTNEVYNGSMDVHGDTYNHKIRCRINLSHPDAEHIGLEDVLGSTGKMAVWAVPSGSGNWKRKLNPAILSAAGGGVFDLDIATEAWEAATYTIYPLFVNGNLDQNNFSFPSNSVGVGSIIVKDVPSYPYVPLDAVIIADENQTAADVSQQTLHIPYSTGSFQLYGFNKDENGNFGTPTDVTHIWSSRSPGIVSIDPSTGLCTFQYPGTATIDLTGRQRYYASINEKTNYVILDCSITIAISISPTTVEMGTGNHTTAQVTGSVSPNNAINRRIEYTSSDSSKVSVQSGASSVESDIPITIYAVAVGSANIIAKAWGDQSKTATCAVNVRQGCTGIAITESSLILYTTSDPVTLHTNVQPNNAYNQAVSFSSSNPNVATVDANGKVTPVGVGTCTITGTTQDTYYSAQQYSDTVSVEVKNPATTLVGVRIDGYNGSIQVGTSVTLKIMGVYADGHAEDKTYANGWSGYTSIYSLSSVGTFTGIAEGNATLTATYGGFSASIPISAYIVHVTSVSLNKASTTILIGGTDQLTATVLPANANNKAVTWSSSNTSVATVSSNGLITAVGVGSCTITVTTQDGGKTATCAVTVNPIPVTGVSLNTSGQTISIGDTYQLVATVTPSNATNKAVTWSSSNTSVARVSSNGLVTAVGAGSAVITVTTQDGGYTATCNIAVPNPAPVVDGIVISGYGGAVNIGSSFTLHVYYHYSDGTTGTTDIANANNWSGYGNNFSISGSGTFTATYEGSCYITYSTGGYTAQVYATASRYVSSIAITSYSTPVALGSGAVQWGITATWRYATNGYTTTTPTSGVTWSSDNSGIASVNSSGQVSPVAVGSTTIRASYGGQPASQSVTVTSQALSLTLSSYSVSMQDSSIDLSVSVTATEGATINVTSTNENLLYATYVSTTKLIRLTARGNASHDTTVNVTVTASKTGYSSVTKNLAVTILTDEPV